ncbi:hypothetical protein [Methylorubrum salsuginis]|uniref:Uncharacterized protein n=1 Tax=Methylorubrum salsuginis TaxID=414703 RepID=A0A1I4I964_9HYPH|nr:hypothetical protein [Methylorubrum salsuginis]SFL50256.1 hypothetical protein SAMN04488125_116105 [Methylorubrum salsuginis]
MSIPHYVVRRSRSGRFNFTLLSEHGRISGVVVVPTEKLSREEIERSARAKIQEVAAALVAAVGGPPEV